MAFASKKDQERIARSIHAPHINRNLKLESNMKDSEIDALVESIKEPIKDLDEVHAELVMAHTYFEVVCTIAIFQGKGTSEEVRKRISDSLTAFLKSNPLPSKH